MYVYEIHTMNTCSYVHAHKLKVYTANFESLIILACLCKNVSTLSVKFC